MSREIVISVGLSYHLNPGKNKISDLVDMIENSEKMPRDKITVLMNGIEVDSSIKLKNGDHVEIRFKE